MGPATKPCCSCVAALAALDDGISSASDDLAARSRDACAKRARLLSPAPAQPSPSPTPPTESTAAAPPAQPPKRITTLPFQGTWFIKSRSCPVKDAEATPDQTVFKGDTRLGYEEFCQEQILRVVGDVITVRESCEGEGSTQQTMVIYQLLNDQTLRLTTSGGSSVFYKCH